MAKKEEAVSTASPKALAMAVKPDFIPQSSNGLEQVGFKDIVLPRLGLCQNNSRARDRSRPEYIKGLEEGDFYNSLTKENYGGIIRIVPLFFYHSRIMFKDMKDGGGIICQAPDGKSCQLNAGGPCLHSGWGPKGEAPECSEFFNYPSLIYRGEGRALSSELIIVSLKTTGLEAGKMLNSFMRMRKTASYAGIYELGNKPEVGTGNTTYYKYTVKNNEDPSWVDPDLYGYAEEQFKTVEEGLRSGRVQVDLGEDDAAFASRDSEV